MLQWLLGRFTVLRNAILERSLCVVSYASMSLAYERFVAFMILTTLVSVLWQDRCFYRLPIFPMSDIRCPNRTTSSIPAVFDTVPE